MNRRNRSRELAAGWAEVRAKETQDRADALHYREESIRAGGAWTPQVTADWREPVYQIRKDLVSPMSEDIRRGQRGEKKLHNIRIKPGVRASHATPVTQSVSTTRDLGREYHFAPSPFSAQALTK